MVKRYAIKVATDKDIHPHCLRHSIATLWLKEGKLVRGIQKQLGHRSLTTTQIYLDYFDDDRKKEFCMLNLSNNNSDLRNILENLSEEMNFIKSRLKFD